VPRGLLKCGWVLSLLLILSLLVGSCREPERLQPPSPVGHDAGEPPVALAAAATFRPRDSVPSRALAYVSQGSVVLRDPWYAPGRTIGTAGAGSAPGWGCDSWIPGSRYLKIAFVSSDLKVKSYSISDIKVVDVPIHLDGPGYSASWSPSGEWLVLDRPGADTGELLIVDPSSGAVKQRFQYFCRWSWCPTGEWIAFGNPRQVNPRTPLGSGLSSDLAVLCIPTGTVACIIEGDSRHILVPCGWLGDALAYGDIGPEADPAIVSWVQAPTWSRPTATLTLPLSLNRTQIGEALPDSLRSSWSGQYTLSDDACLLAVVCTSTEGEPFVYVGDLPQCKWFLVGVGELPAWSPGSK